MLNQDALNRDCSLLIAGSSRAIRVPRSSGDCTPCSGGDRIVLLTTMREMGILRQDRPSVRECGRLALRYIFV